jgi:hypothetical protein
LGKTELGKLLLLLLGGIIEAATSPSVRRVGCMHGENLGNPVRARRPCAIRWFLTNQVNSFYDRCIASTLPSF